MNVNKTATLTAVAILRDIATVKPYEVKGTVKDIKKLNAGKR